MKNNLLLISISIILFLGCNKNMEKSSKLNSVSENASNAKRKSPEVSLDSFKNNLPNENKGNTIYRCGSNLNGNYGGTGYYKYPAYSIELTSSPQGSIISLTVTSYDVPNKFTVSDGYTNVAYTSGMGYATYSGPWGTSLNTPQTQTITFTKDIASNFTLTVETSTSVTSDSWVASISCSAPALKQTNTGNVGLFHNNTINSIDSSFAVVGVYPTSLQTADNKAKSYEKSYISKAKIDITNEIIDSSYKWRNKMFNIKYSQNAIYASRINLVHLVDSLINLPNSSILLTANEKTLMHNLFVYYDQYQKGQISYTTMKSNISSLRSTWNQQGFNVNLHQGDVSMYTLNVADSSVSYWYRYNGSQNFGQEETLLVPAWLAMDAVGALGGAIGAGLDSYLNTGSVNWKSVGSWALGGAVSCSIPSTRWFSSFFK